MSTIRDVASKAQVSVATVSAVLTGNRYVSPELAERVQRAIAETGYRRNKLASGLKSGRSHLVGLVVPDITNPFFTDFIDLIEGHATAAGFSIILGLSKGNLEREAAILDLLRSNRVEGTILCPSGPPRSVVALAKAYGDPLIAVDAADPAGPVDSVTLDNHGAGRMAARHLTELGHRRLAIVAGPGERVSARGRKEGFLAGCADLPCAPEVADGHFTAEGGYLACRALLAKTQWPTAIFVTNNQMLIGVMRGLAEAGVRVPEEMSILGVDDFPWADSFRPALTTIRQPVAEMAREAWAILSERLADPAAETRSAVFPADLIVRGSTSAISAGPDAASA
ncbi:LacI family DNA-binding transcriptional regulator [Ensifer soli]|uniref:LacI family DNA-binding transcriptional regulator n=1 Tax=Ciceribacter sp. sgz301302 TaxID=3342379 RepID=UPI0035BAA345